MDLAEYLINLRNKHLNTPSSVIEEPPSTELDLFDLGGLDCPLCRNSGVIVSKGEHGEILSKQCRCMQKRIALRRIRQSGLSDSVRRYTFESYIAETPEQQKVLAKATDFIAKDEGWFYIFGQSGSGKSHICTAIVGQLIERYNNVFYMAWRDQSTILKALVTDIDRYEEKMQKLKNVPILYIDDFLKGSDSDADIKLAFELLNYRYNDSKLRTIISSEMSLQYLLQRDEALAGRIYERARGYVLKAPPVNMRFKERSA